MTLNQFCDQHDCTPEERELVYYFWPSIRFRAFIESMGLKLEVKK